jgi:hypothetical protein
MTPAVLAYSHAFRSFQPDAAPAGSPPAGIRIEASHHLTFLSADQPLLSTGGGNFLATGKSGVLNEMERMFIRTAKKLLNAMDFPVPGYIFNPRTNLAVEDGRGAVSE